MMAEKSAAEVLLSFLEYKAVYREPIFESWDRQGELASALFRAFREWNVGLENIHGRPNPSNASEIQMTVDLPNRGASFNFGLGAATLFVNNPNWAELDTMAKVAQSGIKTIQASTNADIDKQMLTLAIHLKPQVRSIRDITSSFIGLNINLLTNQMIRSYGFAIYLDDGYWIVDTSDLYSESLFIRLNRTFEADMTFEQLAETLRKDEISLLELLELRID